MDVLAATVNWNYSWGNGPDLLLLVDKFPEGLRYKFKADRSSRFAGEQLVQGAYHAVKDGFVLFYQYNGPSQGFGGQVFNVTLVDGEKRALKGPWSSSCTAMNARGFTPSIEVSITAETDVWDRGHMFFGGYVTIPLARQALGKFVPEAVLIGVGRKVTSAALAGEQMAILGGGYSDGECNTWVVTPKELAHWPKPPMPEGDYRLNGRTFAGKWPLGMRGSIRFDPGQPASYRFWVRSTGARNWRSKWHYAKNYAQAIFHQDPARTLCGREYGSYSKKLDIEVADRFCSVCQNVLLQQFQVGTVFASRGGEEVVIEGVQKHKYCTRITCRWAGRVVEYYATTLHNLAQSGRFRKER